MISDDIFVNEDATVSLICLGDGFPGVRITWSRDEQTLSNSSLVSISEEEVVQEGRILRQSTLQISDIREADGGVYICNVSNSETSANSSTKLTVSCKFTR